MENPPGRRAGRFVAIARFLAVAMGFCLPVWTACSDEGGAAPLTVGAGNDASFSGDVVANDTATAPPACNPACPAGSMCASGVCTLVCGAELALCGGPSSADASAPYCADTKTDKSNCGTCGTTCSAASPDCCGGGCVAFATDPLNCGGCAKVCAGTNCAAGKCIPRTCVEILIAAPAAPSGVYLIDPDGTGAGLPFSAYCDMVQDGGGWTLLITLNTTTVTFQTIAAWPTTVATVSGPPDTTGMYKGTLAPFKDVREEVASGKIKVWGKAKTLAQLELIRKLYAWETRVVAAPTFGDVPSCRLAYATATDDLAGCTRYPGADPNGSSIIGWTVDPDLTYGSHCWFARGNCCSVAGGSSLCLAAPDSAKGDPNATTWARTWFR